MPKSFSALALCWRLGFAFWLLLLPLSKAVAGEQVLESGRITVVYDDPEQLEKFAKKISSGAVSRTLSKVLIGGQGSSGEDLGQYLDRLLQRVQMVLDMSVSKMKIIIRIYDSSSDVLKAFKTATPGLVSQYQNTKPPAFYYHKTKTIYIQTQKLHIGMLAHEMGHAVQYNFFVIPPPLKVQEMLCQYVDREISSGRF